MFRSSSAEFAAGGDVGPALLDHSRWYTRRFGMVKPKWYLFPFGKSKHLDPTRPMTTLKTVWGNIKKTAGITGRWHDTRHTLVTELAESGAGDQTIMDMAGRRQPVGSAARKAPRRS